MFSPELVRPMRSFRIWPFVALAAAYLLFSSAPVSARVFLTTADVSNGTYEEQLLGSASAEGDIWGGEQTVAPDPPKPDEPVITTTTADALGADPISAPRTTWWAAFLGFWLSLLR